ncbi:MAG TPA: TetR/AcrR family transcriptional regulator [Pseudonocardia sp.]|jgi:AcrR family transcriptional regulator
MTAASTREPARPSRGRRGSRPSGDDRELAILTTAERLLAERPLNEISIDDLARGAGISRPTFYFYFRSKDAVLLSLLDRVVAEADRASDEIAHGTGPMRDPAGQWRAVIAAFYRTFSSRRHVAIAAAQLAASNSEVREMWSAVLGGWARRTAQVIQAERDRGAAPQGIPAEQLAVALNLMNERTMFATFAGEQPGLPEGDVVDVLLHVWLTSIYGTTDPS